MLYKYVITVNKILYILLHYAFITTNNKKLNIHVYVL